jgi:predicted HTH transcriptional regulator
VAGEDSPELRELVLHGREERNLEHKGPVDWSDPNVKARLTKCILALSNIRDGGAIVIGVEQDGETFDPVGLTHEQRDSFKQDDVARHVNEFADPYAELTVSHTSLDAKDFVVIQVKEFDELPVVCRRNGIELRGGAIYTRTRRVFECSEVPGQAEIREILDMAVEKGVRRFGARVAKAGYVPAPSDTQRYDDELDGL